MRSVSADCGVPAGSCSFTASQSLTLADTGQRCEISFPCEVFETLLGKKGTYCVESFEAELSYEIFEPILCARIRPLPIQETFPADWLVGVGVEQLTLWKDIILDTLMTVTLVLVLERLGLLGPLFWLETHLDVASVQVRACYMVPLTTSDTSASNFYKQHQT